AELAAELRKLGESGGALLVQEVLPTLEDAWLPGPGGHYYSELVVPVVLRRGAAPSQRPAASAPRTSIPQPAVEDVSPAARSHPPGSDWLYVKLYCPRDHEDDVICESMLTFAENAVASRLADSWFFIRYSDPDP